MIEVTELDREGYLRSKLACLNETYNRLAWPIRYELALIELMTQPCLPLQTPPSNVVKGPWTGPVA